MPTIPRTQSPQFNILRSLAMGMVAGFLLWSIGLPDLAAQSQAEMNIEAAAELDKADKELNVVYQKLLKTHAAEKEFCSDLKEAQRAWLKFVDFHLKTVFPLKEGESPRYVYGSIYPLLYASEKRALILQRVEQLQNLVDNKLQSDPD